MKFNLYQIPDEGMRHKMEVPAGSLQRLCEVIGPQQGSVTFDLFVNQRGGNVEVKGTLRADLQVPCNRCLDPADLVIEEDDVVVTLAPQSRLNDMDEETSLSSGDLEVSFFDGEQINLLTLVEDELLLLIPESVCEEDDDGRCMQCGELTEEMLQSSESEDESHPFAQLKQFIDSDK